MLWVAVVAGKKIEGFGAPPLVAAQPRQARCGAQFPELRPLLSGDAESFVIKVLSGLRRSRLPSSL
jgi:hypothetical protein